MDALEPPPLNRDDFLAALGPALLEAVRREDTDHPLFRGCIDWHSSVHGHWALFRLANAGVFDEGALEAMTGLSTNALEAERRDLAARPDFETPYGRAWFLLLAKECQTWCERTGGVAPEPLRPMAEEQAAVLLDRHRSVSPSLESTEYGNDAWSLLRLHDWFRYARDDAGRNEVESLIRDRFLLPPGGPDFGEDAGRAEFFSRFGNRAHLVASAIPAELGTFLDAHPVEDAHLAPVTALLAASHHLGMNWSRAWALRSLAVHAPDTRDRERFGNAYRAQAETGMKHHDRHKDRYGAYGHWVPQFAVYALTP